VRRKATALQDIRDIIEQKLADMLSRNSMPMDYQVKYEGIIADYNSEKDRMTIEGTFRLLVERLNWCETLMRSRNGRRAKTSRTRSWPCSTC
jgi:type I restriction enzyme R subunit